MSNQELVKQAEEQLKALNQTLLDMGNKPDGIPVDSTDAFFFLKHLVWEINNAISWHNQDSPDQVETFEF